MRFSQRAALVIAAAAVLGIASTSLTLPQPEGAPARSGTPSPSGSSTTDASPSPTSSDEATDAQGPPKGWKASACRLPDEHLLRTIRGYFPGRSPNVTFIAKEPHFFLLNDAQKSSGLRGWRAIGRHSELSCPYNATSAGYHWPALALPQWNSRFLEQKLNSLDGMTHPLVLVSGPPIS
jgi:hypothetical protein